METRVEIYSAGDLIEANAVCAELEEAGIEAVIVGDSLQNAVGDLPFTVVGPRVWVAEGDAMRAGVVVGEWTRKQWPIGEPKQRMPFQFSLKSIFIATTIAAIVAPILPLAYAWDGWQGLGLAVMNVGLIALLVVAYRKKTAWRHEEDPEDAEPVESLECN